MKHPSECETEKDYAQLVYNLAMEANSTQEQCFQEYYLEYAQDVRDLMTVLYPKEQSNK
jgi:hypothetical protein